MVVRHQYCIYISNNAFPEILSHSPEGMELLGSLAAKQARTVRVGVTSVKSGVLAKKMGLPIKLVAVTTVNDIVYRTFKTGDLSVSDKVIRTLSPAMDIQVPYNIERVLYFLSEEKNASANVMEKFYESGKAVLPGDMLEGVNNLISSFSATDELKIKTIKRCFEENNYKLCPHTATAVSYHYHQLDNNVNDGKVHVVISTASAARFPEGLLAAGIEPETHAAFENLMELPRKCDNVSAKDNWEQIMREKIKSLRD
ncbi:Threonine synthase-like 2 [Nymphon striatum]|nr:Threonine synthase-like 2 [Nymphon striatum]